MIHPHNLPFKFSEEGAYRHHLIIGYFHFLVLPYLLPFRLLHFAHMNCSLRVLLLPPFFLATMWSPSSCFIFFFTPFMFLSGFAIMTPHLGHGVPTASSLAFFLTAVLTNFAPFCPTLDDVRRVYRTF